MTPEVKYERVAKFIFGVHRHGGAMRDAYDWMANELQVVRPKEDDKAALESLQASYLAKFVSDEEFSESYQRFMKMMEQRRS